MSIGGKQKTDTHNYSHDHDHVHNSDCSSSSSSSSSSSTSSSPSSSSSYVNTHNSINSDSSSSGSPISDSSSSCTSIVSESSPTPTGSGTLYERLKVCPLHCIPLSKEVSGTGHMGGLNAQGGPRYRPPTPVVLGSPDSKVTYCDSVGLKVFHLFLDEGDYVCDCSFPSFELLNHYLIRSYNVSYLLLGSLP